MCCEAPLRLCVQFSTNQKHLIISLSYSAMNSLQNLDSLGIFDALGIGRCVAANLGAAYYSMGDYPEALKKENHLVRVSCEWHRLCGCEEAKEATALALSRQGRALQAMHSLPAALDAFKASVSMYAHTGNTLQHAQQFANTGQPFR